MDLAAVEQFSNRGVALLRSIRKLWLRRFGPMVKGMQGVEICGLVFVNKGAEN